MLKAKRIVSFLVVSSLMTSILSFNVFAAGAKDSYDVQEDSEFSICAAGSVLGYWKSCLLHDY
jgi:hypothetical protein